MFDIPVVLFIYKRINTSIQVIEVIKKIKPSIFYLVADGPKGSIENTECDYIRKYIENQIDWNCKFIKIYSPINLGLAKRVSSGLDLIFSNEKYAIILEDDTLPDPSFFNFCKKLLKYYENDQRVGHISGCNHYPKAFDSKSTYYISSVINIWGWATWKRAWEKFDLNMPSWKNIDKKNFLSKWCLDSQKRKGLEKMFDLHCSNNDPWAWSYQWSYSCYANDLLSIMPKINLVSNIGIGPNGTNTITQNIMDSYPKIESSLDGQIIHPEFKRDYCFEKSYYKMARIPFSRRIKNVLKRFL